MCAPRNFTILGVYQPHAFWELNNHGETSLQIIEYGDGIQVDIGYSY